ncbi:hypothetical protein ACIQXD_32920 [Streptomyces uncialis]|uniref:hypothetical protein n=1 Tax=Streptomyces uncialis TaxID=1048205 RepID=UPI00380F4475
MTSTADSRLQRIVEQSAEALTDADGRFHKRRLTDAVREQLTREDLDPRIRAAALDRLAQSLVTGFGEHRNPRRRRTGALFHPRDLVKLGTGVWVWMDRATDSDLLEWSRLSRRNRARVDLADTESRTTSTSASTPSVPTPTSSTSETSNAWHSAGPPTRPTPAAVRAEHEPSTA